MNMKKIVVCLAAIVAFLACSVSCSKDDPVEQSDDVRELIIEAIDAASLPVCDKNGREVGMATLIDISHISDGPAFRSCIFFNQTIQVDSCDHFFMEVGKDECVEVKEMEMVAENVAITELDLEVAGKVAETVKPLLGNKRNNPEFLVNMRELFKRDVKKELSTVVLSRQEVNANLEEYVGQVFMAITTFTGMTVTVQGIMEVHEIKADGADDMVPPLQLVMAFDEFR